jgi:hypothetical protein
MIAKRGCNIETSVYTGNGIDPPTCGAHVVLNRMCVMHVRERIDELQRDIERSEKELAEKREELMSILLRLARQS